MLSRQQPNRPPAGGGLRNASLVSVACLVFLGIGFYTGRLVGLNSCGGGLALPLFAAKPSGAAPTSSGTAPSSSSSSKGSSSTPAAAVRPIISGTGITADTLRASVSSDGSNLGTTPLVTWPPEATAKGQPALCFDTCPKARDGVCDEGRLTAELGPSAMVMCDLGTDCADCGAWTPTTASVPWGKDGKNGPISRLLARKVEVRVKRTTMPLMFIFAYTNPVRDHDVSASMHGSGQIEPDITKVFHEIFHAGCLPAGAATTGDQRGVFADVGANFGWYSVMAAVMGCRVVAFEPVPDFHAFLEYNLHVNGVAHLVDVRQLIVSSETGVRLNMTVPSDGIWGTAGIGGLNIDRNIKGTHEIISVQSVRLDEIIRQKVLLMKMDVEGWEYSVFAGAAELDFQHGITNIIFEYSPGVHERNSKYPELELTIRMLVDMLAAKFSIAHIPDGGPHIRSWSWPFNKPGLPPMKEVTAHNLQYDLKDLENFRVGKLSCPRLKEVEQTNPRAWSCNGIPEDVSPRSLHSVMGHNTNLWASKARAAMPLAGPVGLVGLDAPIGQYFPDKGAVWGTGRRLCQSIPHFVQVRHRCLCEDKTKCGVEEAAIRKLSEEGGDKYIGSNYLLPPP